MSLMDLFGSSKSNWSSNSLQNASNSWTHNPSGNKRLATFGAGCYWGTEKYFCTEFAEQHPGAILSANVGFMSPNPKAIKDPSYEQVCSGRTGHIEVVHFQYDSSKCTYQDMVKFFYTFHDPTTLNRQGYDSGTQYSSVIFYHDLD